MKYELAIPTWMLKAINLFPNFNRQETLTIEIWHFNDTTDIKSSSRRNYGLHKFKRPRNLNSFKTEQLCLWFNAQAYLFWNFTSLLLLFKDPKIPIKKTYLNLMALLWCKSFNSLLHRQFLCGNGKFRSLIQFCNSKQKYWKPLTTKYSPLNYIIHISI